MILTQFLVESVFQRFEKHMIRVFSISTSPCEFVFQLFPCCYNKIINQNNLGKNEFILAPSARMPSFMSESPGSRNRELRQQVTLHLRQETE